MFSIFGSGSCEEVHYCRKYLFAAVEIWRFFRRSFNLLSGREKQVDFSSLSPKAGRCFQMAKGNILYNFFSDVPKLFIVVSDQAFSILLMIFLSCPP